MGLLFLKKKIGQLDSWQRLGNISTDEYEEEGGDFQTSELSHDRKIEYT